MAVTEAVESFWMQLAQSGLVPPRQVRVLARALAQEGVTTDAVVARKLVEMGHLTRYQADRLLEGRSRGFFFDQYKLLDLLGVGGMGWVYRAAKADTGEIFALKVLIDQYKNDRGMVVRFEHEARAGLKFQHDNIVRTFDCGSAGGLPYVVMEYIEGPSLLELLRLRERSRLAWEQACEVIRQAAVGLQHVHESGFVHRDVKPQNLLIDHMGHVKLLDFGLAMLREGESGDEFSMAMIFGHECVGTAAFMAPEQATDSLKADAQSDIYSLGCTMFAILTGDTPFPFSETKDVLKGHQSTVPRHVSDVVPAIPRAVGDIVAKMLAKKPEDRFATAMDVANALSIWSTSMPVEFDFDKILTDRNKTAREKLAELQKRQRSASNATNSTAKPAAISSVAGSSTGAMKIVGIENRSPSFSSSIVRRDPFGFEHPPAIVVRQPVEDKPEGAARITDALKSGMVLIPLGGGSVVPLMKDRFVIGRGAQSDLQIQDGSVSSRHCELQFDGQQWTLNDLNSRNGVRVNGENIKTHVLQRGDIIIIGSSLRLRFTDRLGSVGGWSSDRSRSILKAVVAVAALGTFMAAVFRFWPLGGQ